jgi:NAD-dependent SIR2 family protein deacetylase
VTSPAGTDVALDELAALVRPGGVVVLSGAGLSTESGIPDYRGPTGLARARAPMTYQAFVADPAARQRYWARSHLGWRQIAQATPNAGHRAVAGLERLGLADGVVTQNVDGLHQRAGARAVLELHGNLATVRCLDCGTRSTRQELDGRLDAANPGWRAGVVAVLRPDGDAEPGGDAVDRFRTVDCRACGGMLKPDVVFFGENVPAERVDESYRLVAAARLLLVLGSSLTVMSGHRFVLRASKLGVPVAIVNQGATRGDVHAVLTVDQPLGLVLPGMMDRLAAPP